MRTKYPGKPIKKAARIPTTPEKYLKDVVYSFSIISHRPSYLAAHENDLFGSSEYKRIQNHFQGIIRMNVGDYFLISGGSKQDSRAHLLLIHMGFFAIDKNSNTKKNSHYLNGPIGSNIITSSIPPQQDCVEEIYWLNKGKNKYWHAGGMSLCGDILAIALENQKDNRSTIYFYNTKNPKDIFQISNARLYRANTKAGAVALTKLKNKKFLCVVWSDSDKDKSKNPPRFDFYVSKNQNDLSNWNLVKTVYQDNLVPESDKTPKFQSIQILKQKNGDLFILGTFNTKSVPGFGGTNMMFLYKLEISINKNMTLTKLQLTKISERRLADGDNHIHFAAAAGAYIYDNKLAIYGAHHWRSSEAIRFGEYYELSTKSKKITKVSDIRIELYEHSGFKGRCLYMYGSEYINRPDYSQVTAQGRSFGGKISSIRAIIPKGKTVVFKDKNAKRLSIVGTGYLIELPTIRKFDNSLVSSKLI